MSSSGVRAGGNLVVRVDDFPTPQDAANALTTGGTLWFSPGKTYALTAAVVVSVDNVTIDSRGATITQATWATPAFDGATRSGIRWRLGDVKFIGTRGPSGDSSFHRGQSLLMMGAAIYVGWDRNTIESLHSYGFPVGVNLSSWDGVNNTAIGNNGVGRIGIGNRVVAMESEGADFGLFWIGQSGLVIDYMYGHDDIDDSAGGNPTHAIYCSATATFRSSDVKIDAAHADTIKANGGAAFQFKYCDNLQIGRLTANNCTGIINVIDSNDISWDSVTSTNTLAGAVCPVTVQTVAANSQRPKLGKTTVLMAANQDQGLVSIYADNADIDGVIGVSNHPTGANTALYDVRLGGNNGTARGVHLVSAGAEHVQGIQVGSSGVPTGGWSIQDPTVNGQRSTVTIDPVVTSAAPVGIRYDPARQTLTGTGAQITGASSSYYLTGNVPTQGELDATSNLTLSTTKTTLPGTSLTIAPVVGGKITVCAHFDLAYNTSGDLLGGGLVVDGVLETSQVYFQQSGTTRGRMSRSWCVPLAAGSHTISIQAWVQSGTGTTHVVNATHSGFTYSFAPAAG